MSSSDRTAPAAGVTVEGGDRERGRREGGRESERERERRERGSEE